MAVNSDASVQRLKGPTRPINDQETRSTMLSALDFVDLVVVFEEDTPKAVIETLVPNILVKGGDYKPTAHSVPNRGHLTVFTDKPVYKVGEGLKLLANGVKAALE